MKCVYCKNPKPADGGYVCDDCLAKAAIARAKVEDLARTVACPSCPAMASEQCLITGSKVPRSAHITREKLSQRLAR